jgi:hypothetical protein
MFVEVLGGADGTDPPAAVVGDVGVSYWALTRTGRKKAAKAMENFMVASKSTRWIIQSLALPRNKEHTKLIEKSERSWRVGSSAFIIDRSKTDGRRDACVGAWECAKTEAETGKSANRFPRACHDSLPLFIFYTGNESHAVCCRIPPVRMLS